MCYVWGLLYYAWVGDGGGFGRTIAQEMALQIYKLLVVPADGGGDRGSPDPTGTVFDNTENGIDNGMLELASAITSEKAPPKLSVESLPALAKQLAVIATDGTDIPSVLVDDDLSHEAQEVHDEDDVDFFHDGDDEDEADGPSLSSLMQLVAQESVQGCHGKDAPCPKFISPLIAKLKKAMYISLIHPMGQTLCIMLTKLIHDPLQKMLHAGLSFSLRDYLNTSLTHAVEHTLANTVALTTTHTVPRIINKLLPPYLFHSLTTTLTHTLTRSLVHTLAPSVISSLAQTPAQRYYCYFCQHQGAHCQACKGHSSTELTMALYYGEFYASYYSDYYADMYARNIFVKRASYQSP